MKSHKKMLFRSCGRYNAILKPWKTTKSQNMIEDPPWLKNICRARSTA